MAESVLILLLLSILPFMVIIFGRIFMYKAPKRINWAYGYRTDRSMKNEQTWAFAHQTIGKVWFYGGMVLELVIFITIVVFYELEVIFNDTIVTVFMLLPLLFMFITISYTEQRLKKTFDDKGNKK